VLERAGKRLIVHRDPNAGRRASVTVYSEHEPVAPLAAATSEFRAIRAFVREAWRPNFPHRENTAC